MANDLSDIIIEGIFEVARRIEIINTNKYDEIKNRCLKYKPTYTRGKAYNTVSFTDYGQSKRVQIKLIRFLSKKLDIRRNMFERAPNDLDENELKRVTEHLQEVLWPSKIKSELVSGSKITESYKNRVGNKSCMTGSNSIYTQMYEMNPDKVKLLIVRAGRQSARRLIWCLDNGDKLADRIYCCSTLMNKKIKEITESIQGIKFDYEKQSDWCLCELKNILRVSGLKWEVGKIPYIDTFRYGCIHPDNTLRVSFYRLTPEDKRMESTDGNYIPKHWIEKMKKQFNTVYPQHSNNQY